MEYRILYSQYYEKLKDKVQEFLDEGWKPQGGLAASNGHLYQAIVRGEEGFPLKNPAPFTAEEIRQGSACGEGGCE